MFGKIPRWKLFAAFFAALTVGVMALFFNLYEPWHPIGPERISDGSFSTPTATNVWGGWNEHARLVPDGGVNGSPGVVLTAATNGRVVLRFTLSDLTGIPAFRVSLRAAAQGIVHGKKGYHIPRTVFVYQDAKGKKISGVRHSVMHIQKDTGWRYYKDFFPVQKNAAKAHLYIQNLAMVGVMQADDVSVIPVRARPSAPWWKLFFGLLWITAFGICLFTLKPWARRYGLPVTAVMLIILAGITMPGGTLDSSIEKTYEITKTTVDRITPPAPKSPALADATPARPKEEVAPFIAPVTVAGHTHMVGHFVLFSLLAFFAALSWITGPSVLRRTLALFAGLVFFAAATEVLQFITADREGSLRDVLTDTAGMAGAIILVLLLRCIQRLINRYKH